jgi:hypothetical protein
MLVHEIIGFPVASEMHVMPLLLEVMPEMKTAGGMTESFAADNKEDLHIPAGWICPDG